MAVHGTPEGFNTWLAARGYVLPDGAPSAAILLQRATDYIDALYGQRFRGEPAGGIDQERAWPRVNATFWKASVPADAIPRNVVIASYHAALHEAQNPGSLAVAATAIGAVKREKIDVLETEYFQGSGDVAADATVRLSAVEGLLAPFLVPEGQGSGLGLWAVG